MNSAIPDDAVESTAELLEAATRVIRKTRAGEVGDGDPSFLETPDLGERVMVAQLLLQLRNYQDHASSHEEEAQRKAEAFKKMEEMKMSLVQGLPMPVRDVPPEEMPTQDQAVLDVTFYKTAFGWVVKSGNSTEEKLMGAKNAQELLSALGRIGVQVLKGHAAPGTKP